MTKSQRELLILGGILATLGGVLVLRSLGGEETPPVAPAGDQASRPAPGTAAGRNPGTTPGGNPATPRGQAQVQVQQAMLLDQYPIQILNPALSDSAVAQRITSGFIPDPFQADRGRRATPATTTRNTPAVPTRTQPRTTRQLDAWPEGIRYQGLIRDMQAGTFNARFNNRVVRLNELIPGTPWKLMEASRVLVRIRDDTSSRTIIFEYRYIVPQPSGAP